MRRIPILLAMTLPSAALAHTGYETGDFGAGFGHPLGGADHVLAMMALGLLAAQIGGRAIWALPATFVGAMLLGGLLGAGGAPFPGVEPAILASCIILGAMVALALRLSLPVMLAGTAFFGMAHGWAHGAEGPGSGLLIYAAGFAFATTLLHGVGIVTGRAVPAMALRLAGGMAMIAGAALVVSG